MFEQSQNVMNALKDTGAFLCAGENVMTVGWGAIGYFWKKPCLLIPVRESRYTKTFLDKLNCFTLSVPFSGMKKELAYCGTKSGRDVDKFMQTGMRKLAARSIEGIVIDGCDKYYECKTLCKIPLNNETLLKEVSSFYANGDYHELYIAEIVNEYSL